MVDILNAVLIKIPEKCRAKQCREAKCSLKLNNLPKPCVLIDMDCEKLKLTASNRCDYLFISNKKKQCLVAPIELKSGGLDASQVIKQLQAGSNFAARIIPDHYDVEVQFTPIVAYGGGAHPRELKKLKGQRIRFRQVQAQIKLTRCGKSLSDQLR